MRGTLERRNPHQGKTGIIPAHAGNTDLPVEILVVTGDHPRACGEHVRLGVQAGLVLGSSPRMRGTLQIRFPIVFPGGIIPAHAGNTRGLSP